MHVLPICPRPYEQEAARSWLARVGQIYGLNAERLVGVLGLIPFQPGSGSRLSRPVEAALDARCLEELALAAQLPPARLAEMRPGPVDWTLTHSHECSACALCLEEDLRKVRQPYLRAAWRESWRIFCPTHGVRLVRCPMNVVKGHWSGPRLADAIGDLLAQSEFIEEYLQSLHIRDTQFMDHTRVVREMETVIGRAIAGEAPNFYDWGPLTAPEFLQVAHDVTTWSLTNFEAFKARPPSEDLPSRTSLWATPYHKTSHRYQAPFESALTVRTLSSVNPPELRCPALWWAHALLCETHRCPDPENAGLPARQWAFLRGRCPVGLHWLHQHMAHWPATYVRQHWIALDRLF